MMSPSFTVVVYQAPKANVVSICAFSLQQLDERAKIVVPSSDAISEVSSPCYNSSVDYPHHKELLCIPPQSHEDGDTVTSGNVSFLTDSLLPQASAHNGNSESAFGDDELVYEENDSMPTAVQDSELLNEEVDQEQRVDDDIASLDLGDWETNPWDQTSRQSVPKNESDVSFSLENESRVHRSREEDSHGSMQELKSTYSTEEDLREEGMDDDVDSREESVDDDVDLHEDVNDAMDSHEEGVNGDVDSREDVDDTMHLHEESVDDTTDSPSDNNIESHEEDVDSHEEDSPMDELNSHTDNVTTPSDSIHTDVETSSHTDNVDSYVDPSKSHFIETEASLEESDLPADDDASHLDQLPMTQENSRETPSLHNPSSLVPTSVLRKKMATKPKPIARALRPKEPPHPVKTLSEPLSNTLSSETPLVLSTSDLFLNSTPTASASVCLCCLSDP